MEETFVMVKPDGVAKSLVGEIIKRYEAKGLSLAALQLDRLSVDIAKTHYGEHADKPFFPSLVEHVTSGPVVLMVLRGEDAVKAVRMINGATDPIEADPGTIRGDYALEITENIVHGSDAPETATREIGIFFPGR